MNILISILVIILLGINSFLFTTVHIQSRKIHTLEVNADLNQEHMKQFYFGMKDLAYQIDVLTQTVME